MKTMKNTIYTVLIGLALVFTATSCSKDDDGGSGGDAAAGTIKAKVDGTVVTTLEMVTIATLTGSNLNIQGNTGGTSSKAFVLQIQGLDGVGTYPIGGGANIFNVATYTEITVDISNPANTVTNNWQAPFDEMEVGEIRISELTDTKVVGTFNFTGKNVNGDNSTKQITEGSFNINF